MLWPIKYTLIKLKHLADSKMHIFNCRILLYDEYENKTWQLIKIILQLESFITSNNYSFLMQIVPKYNAYVYIFMLKDRLPL